MSFFFMSLLLALGIVDDVPADAYDDARSKLVSAYRARDYAGMRAAAAKALAARPAYPGALFNRALAETLDGDAEASLATLNRLVAAGIDFGVANIPEFEPLQALPGWAAYEAAVDRLNEPKGQAVIAYTYDAGDFVPEGIAVGANGELYLGGIRHGQIVRIEDGVSVLSEANGHWSVFGMRLDEQGGLWFASASVPEFAGGDADAGRTGLFRLETASGKMTAQALLATSARPLVLGDLIIVDGNTLYATESLAGILYRYSIVTGEFTEIIGPGSLRSMQGLAADASGRYLYVADYVGGLFRVSLAEGRVTRVAADDSVSLFGIDGLYRYGDELIAIQNGIRPHRVVGLTLSADGLAVRSSRVLASNLPEFDEPTLGQVVGDEFYFVANSHWNRFDRDGNLPEGLAGPVVMKLSLRE